MMKKNVLVMLVFCGLASLQTLRAEKSSVVLNNRTDSVSYIAGRLFGMPWDDSEVKDVQQFLDKSLFQSAFLEAYDGVTSAVNMDDAYEYFSQFMEDYQEELSEKVIAEGEAFLSKNAMEPGVEVTQSGLQYRVIEAGSPSEGSPSAHSYVEAYYVVKRLDGRVLDQSYPADDPTQERTSGTLDTEVESEGLVEGLMMMSPGSKYIFYIPSELNHYRGTSGRSTIIAEVEMVSYEDYENSYYGYDVDDEDDVDFMREAGDYYRVKLPEVSLPEEYRDHENIYYDEQTNCYYLFDYDYFTLLDSEYRELDRYYSGAGIYYSPMIYRPNSGSGPVFLGIRYRQYGEYMGRQFYKLEGGQLKEMGMVAMVGVDEDYYYYSEEGDSDRFEIYKKGTTYKFIINADKIKVIPNGDSDDAVQFAPDDLYYTYSGGKLKEQGPATKLVSFARANVLNQVNSRHNDRAEGSIDAYIFGDFNGDGHEDIVYTLTTSYDLHVQLCKTHQLKKKMKFDIGQSYVIVEDPRVVRNGEISLSIHNNNGYYYNGYDDYEYEEGEEDEEGHVLISPAEFDSEQEQEEIMLSPAEFDYQQEEEIMLSSAEFDYQQEEEFIQVYKLVKRKLVQIR